MKPDYTDITIVLDRSGSMASVASDTIGGFNRFLADQQQVPGEATITLNQFDSHYERILDAVPIRDAKPLTRATFVPRGMTALLDAIGKSIDDTGRRLEAKPEHERPSKVICVIITDGQENSSRSFKVHKIADMIAEQRDKYAWEFVFLGANQDAIASAATIGIRPANAMTYAHNSRGVGATYDSLSKNVTGVRCRMKADMSFDDDDRKAQVQAQHDPVS